MNPRHLEPYINRQFLINVRNILRLISKTTQNLIMSQTQPSSSSPDPPPFDPNQPSVPISYPIKTLQDLQSRSYFDSFHYPFNISSVPISSSKLPNRRRLLVCHDMAGGYSDDKWIQGGSNPDAYAIWHWHLIDVFVYFSHSLVTLPPPCWVNTAHRHGVKVLGTFITEWEEGKATCDVLLSTKESAQMYAERLTELAVRLGFDGWLINMEVKLDPKQIPNLKEFVDHLSLTMHSSLPGSLVVWYDSVTIDGELNWQDQLNEYNKPFFDICDGIFVNYTWKESYPKLSADVAGDRKFDVYMGIDVFGRNTYGGGQWNANVALDVIRKNEVSAAIFAPGWVYETKQPPDFETAQNSWWGLVEKSWGVLPNYSGPLPLHTNFDQGRGYHISVDGNNVSDASWCNISCQGFQPLLPLADTRNPIQVTVDLKEASYSGGGNLTFKGSLDKQTYFETKILQGEFLLTELPIHFTYSVKSNGNSSLGLKLVFTSNKDQTVSALLTSQEVNHFSSKFDKVITTRKQKEVSSGWVINESEIEMNGYTLTEIYAVCYRSDSSLSDYYALLGHITVKSSNYNPDFPVSSSWLVDGKFIKWTSGSNGSKTLSIKLSWTLKDGKNYLSLKYNIYVVKSSKQAGDNPSRTSKSVKEEYLGVAQVNCFYVSDLEIPSDSSSLKFIIQVCSVDGTIQALNDSPYYELKVESP
ncbi:cytosolic endo-beta-N-acetylglucosaminidase 1-like [Vicia villosa]|uniref:cytosolic endo-beta-N-acetylglucosaminidase 1-like n=1 Tax=Vicia villosa TaxID=3911 RepID=UPI00273BEC44|nr:cytosolic endo-beta-N-acetylglucosaminidase 1-like [Vicia villosa]